MRTDLTIFDASLYLKGAPVTSNTFSSRLKAFLMPSPMHPSGILNLSGMPTRSSSRGYCPWFIAF